MFLLYLDICLYSFVFMGLFCSTRRSNIGNFISLYLFKWLVCVCVGFNFFHFHIYSVFFHIYWWLMNIKVNNKLTLISFCFVFPHFFLKQSLSSAQEKKKLVSKFNFQSSRISYDLLEKKGKKNKLLLV